tara:strand:+ start:362 stop:658 length:297 start_codon:yes stop_codon:yes gene_type:complete
MECNECNGTGWVKTWSYGHDVMIREQCYTCMAHEKHMQDLILEISKMLSNTSKQRLAKAFATKLIDLTDKFCAGDFSNVEKAIENKDVETIFMSMEVI